MNISTYKKAIPYLLKAEVVPFVWGPAGVGKTSSVKQLAESMGYGLIVLHLGQMADAGDLMGLPEIIRETDPEILKASNGKRKGYTTFMPPEWVPTSGKWIIFLDELNRASRDVLQAAFQLILERRTHSITLPEETRVMAAGNPNTDQFITTDVSDAAFMDRFCHIKMTPDTEEWIDFARSQKYAPEVINYISQNYASLGNDMPAFDLERKPSPRSWDAVSRLIQVETPEPLLLELAAGLVGVAAATALIESIKSFDQPVKAIDIFENFDKVRHVVDKYSDKLNTRQDLLKITVDELLKLVAENKSPTSAQEKNVIDFLMALPLEMSFIASKDLFTINDWMKRMVKRTDFMKMLKKDLAPIKNKLNALQKEKDDAEAAAAKAKQDAGDKNAVDEES
jgi:hypothetical protein